MLLDMYVACDGDLFQLNEMCGVGSPDIDVRSYTAMHPTISSLLMASPGAFATGGWAALLPAPTRCIYQLVCLADLHGSDLLQMLESGETEMMPALTDPLPELDDDPCDLTLADGRELDAPETVGGVLSLLMDLGLIAHEQGTLVAIRPVPDPQTVLDLPEPLSEMVADYRRKLSLYRQIERAEEAGLPVTLSGLAFELGESVDTVRETLDELADSPEARDGISELDPEQQFEPDYFGLFNQRAD